MSAIIKAVTYIHNMDHSSDLGSAVFQAQVEGHHKDLWLVAQVLHLSLLVSNCHHLSPHVSPCHELTVDHQDGRSIAVHRALLASSPLIALAEEACCCHLPRVSPAPGQETVGVAGGAGWGDLADRAGGGQPPVHRAV